ncbi:sodium channel protein Nach-like [Fopius arisanus]|uniref:Sodium channel protein Nach-like n=1 Tax=Fopius arisanus TaxID=64838 RepID=A0A9R1TDJ1_9HYME|nr:PREDICTED: sodium channel protein Nach-like [Fopius arisanus]
MAFLASAFTVYSTTVDYRNAPAATHMVTDMYPVKEIDFPAVAICNMNLISKRKIMELAEEILQMDSVRAMNVTKSKFLELLKTMGHLYTFSSDEEEPGDLLLLHEIMVNAFSGARRKNVGMVSKMIVVECDNYAVRCQWGGVIRMCSDILEPRFTSDGQCCAFNYARWKDHFSSSLSDKMSAPVLKSEVAGSDYGLWLLLDVNSEDYFYQLLPMIGFKVMIYSPTDYPDSPSGSSREILVARSTETLINIGASIFDTTDDAHSMDPVHRSCRFKTELEAQFGGRYSFSDCIVDCRVRDIIKKCNCIPFFYPHPSGYGE